jgi:hypothetical protein
VVVLIPDPVVPAKSVKLATHRVRATMTAAPTTTDTAAVILLFTVIS